MKKVLAISIAVLMVLAFAVAAQAAEDNWRFKIVADEGTGMSSLTSQLGMYPTSSDGVDGQDVSFGWISPPGAAIQNCTVGYIGGVTTTAYTNTINRPYIGGAPVAGQTLSTWTLRVAAGPDATFSTLRLRFLTIGSPVLPPATFQGVGVKYYLTMIDNRSVAGAPANGMEWEIPIPTTHSTTVPYFTLTMPSVKSPTFDAQGFWDAGYAMQFRVQVPGGEPPVPEPSSLLALGTGLSGLAGFVIRRRRA